LCGECRQPKGKAHRIYLDLEDLVDEQVALVADGLNAINMEASPSAIKKFNHAARKLRQKPDIDPAVTRALLEAVEDLKERVAPLAEQCSEYKNLNQALNRQLQDVQCQFTTSRDKLKSTKLSLQTEKEETKRLRLAVDRQRKAKEEVLTENKEMQAQLDAKDKENKLLEKKLRALSKKQKVKSTHDVEEDSDSSFQVIDKKLTSNNLKQELGAKRRQIKRRVPSSDIEAPRPVKKLRK